MIALHLNKRNDETEVSNFTGSYTSNVSFVQYFYVTETLVLDRVKYSSPKETKILFGAI